MPSGSGWCIWALVQGWLNIRHITALCLASPSAVLQPWAHPVKFFWGVLARLLMPSKDTLVPTAARKPKLSRCNPCANPPP